MTEWCVLLALVHVSACLAKELLEDMIAALAPGVVRDRLFVNTTDHSGLSALHAAVSERSDGILNPSIPPTQWHHIADCRVLQCTLLC
jgi:hypothetical protein